MDPLDIIALISEAVTIMEKIVSIGSEMTPVFVNLFNSISSLVKSFTAGEEITNDQIESIRVQIRIIDDANTAAEDALLNNPDVTE